MARDSGPEELASALARVARDLLDQASVQQTLDRVVAHAVELVAGCELAGVVAIDGGRLRTLAATDDAVRESDRIQVELGEGPCLDPALSETRGYRIDDLGAADGRWPRFAPKARELGIGSALGFLLSSEDRVFGVLSVYNRAPHAFSEGAEDVGLLLAAHATVAFASASSDAQLQRAIASRQEIGAALGIVMERHKLTEAEAFALLRNESQVRNVKLRVLARVLTETGELPGQ